MILQLKDASQSSPGRLRQLLLLNFLTTQSSAGCLFRSCEECCGEEGLLLPPSKPSGGKKFPPACCRAQRQPGPFSSQLEACTEPVPTKEIPGRRHSHSALAKAISHRECPANSPQRSTFMPLYDERCAVHALCFPLKYVFGLFQRHSPGSDTPSLRYPLAIPQLDQYTSSACGGVAASLDWHDRHHLQLTRVVTAQKEVLKLTLEHRASESLKSTLCPTKSIL